MLIGEYLQSADIVVTMVSSGKDALAALRKEPIDFIVLDLMMPEMDGFEILRYLNADAAARRIPVLVVTAKDLTQDEEKFLTRHTSALVHKGADLQKNLLASVGLGVARCFFRHGGTLAHFLIFVLVNARLANRICGLRNF